MGRFHANSELGAQTKEEHDEKVLARLGKKSVLTVRGRRRSECQSPLTGAKASIWFHLHIRVHVYDSGHLGRKLDVIDPRTLLLASADRYQSLYERPE